MHENSIFFGPLTLLLSILCVFMRIASRANGKKKKKKKKGGGGGGGWKKREEKTVTDVNSQGKSISFMVVSSVIMAVKGLTCLFLCRPIDAGVDEFQTVLLTASH